MSTAHSNGDKPTSQTVPPAPSLAVVLLSGVGDSQGESGGRSAARKLNRLVEGELAKKGGEGEKRVMVYLVADASKARGDFANFLGGFASSTSKLTIVVPPASRVSGSVERVAQLANFYLPLPFVSTVFLGTTESDSFLDVLQALPRAQREKLVLLETEANKHTRLIVEGGFATLAVEPGLFATKTEELNGTGEEDREEVETRFVPTAAYPAVCALDGPFTLPRLSFGPGPRPYRDFYLYRDGCKKGSNCRYSHTYTFTEQEWLDFPLSVKAMICPRARDKGKCKWEKDCYMGHRCPYTAEQCPFGARCNFLIAGLPHSLEHRAEEDSSANWQNRQGPWQDRVREVPEADDVVGGW
ncbi:hypothetical protein JCM11641_008190 [Rhodosporidiobolus odoratus]